VSIVREEVVERLDLVRVGRPDAQLDQVNVGEASLWKLVHCVIVREDLTP
jgi:hypothetical protein